MNFYRAALLALTSLLCLGTWQTSAQEEEPSLEIVPLTGDRMVAGSINPTNQFLSSRTGTLSNSVTPPTDKAS
jgi:hypothetical protein